MKFHREMFVKYVISMVFEVYRHYCASRPQPKVDAWIERRIRHQRRTSKKLSHSGHAASLQVTNLVLLQFLPLNTMPFRHQQSLSSSGPSPHNHNVQQPSGATAGIFHAAQALGSIGAPTGNLRTATSGTIMSGRGDSFSNPTGGDSSMAGSNPGGTPNYGLPTHPASGMTPQRSSQYGRNDELHMATRGPPRIALEQPEQYSTMQPGALPSTLQPGRPSHSSSNTAPAIPTLSPMEKLHDYSSSSRPPALSASHSYSRSSPAAPFEPYLSASSASADQSSSLTSPSKYTPAQQRNVSNTPLGLADIRPRADSTAEGLPGANPYSYDGASSTPTNSNYLAPWAIYAFDWCKWPAQNGEAGKVAVGSYLEDGHNFVWLTP
jgi:WD repeat-containing protein 68